MWLAFTHHWLTKALRPILRALKLRVEKTTLYSLIFVILFVVKSIFARPPPVI